MIPIAPICWGCRHLRDGDETCDAFPSGIPDAILGNETDHRLPVKGDHDIRFDPMSPEAADWAEHVFGPAPVAVGEYAMAGVTEYAYSPTQPRKSDGKFGTGGASGGGSTASGSGDTDPDVVTPAAEASLVKFRSNLSDHTQETGAIIDPTTGEVKWQSTHGTMVKDADGFDVQSVDFTGVDVPSRARMIVTHTHPSGLPGNDLMDGGLSDGDIHTASHSYNAELRAESDHGTFIIRPGRRADPNDPGDDPWENDKKAAERNGTGERIKDAWNRHVGIALETLYRDHLPWVDEQRAHGNGDADVQVAIRVAGRETAKEWGYEYEEVDRGGLMELPF